MILIAYPMVDIVDSGSGSLLERARCIYARVYNVPVSEVTEKTPLGERFADIVTNVTFQLRIPAVGSPEVTIGQMIGGR